MRKALDLSLYLVTDRHLCRDRNLIDIIRQTVSKGVSLVQLREKHCSTREFVSLGREVRDLLKKYNIPLFINDRFDVALAIEAHGVHLGQDDMRVEDARRIVGKQMYLGLTIDSEEQVREAEALDVDYLGVGPIFPTQTKADNCPPWGLEGLKKIRSISRHPLVAIGGINSENASGAIQAGASGVAVVSAICAAQSPGESAASLLQAVRSAAKKDQGLRNAIP